MSNFISMGGYGFYVWSAFGITALMLLTNGVLSLLKHRKLLRLIK